VLEGLLVMGEGRKGKSLDFACQHPNENLVGRLLASLWHVLWNIAGFCPRKGRIRMSPVKKVAYREQVWTTHTKMSTDFAIRKYPLDCKTLQNSLDHQLFLVTISQPC
jgi:hypothetical protein